MGSSRFLAFDLGAQSGRGLIGELQDGRLSVREITRFPNGMIPVRGRLHWNLLGLYERIKEGLRLCAEEGADQPLSVGVDTWGVDFGLLAEDGSILGMPYGYRDSHTEGAMDSFFGKVARDRVYELTGIQFLPFNSLFQLEAMMRDKSPLLDVASDLLFMPDLIHYLLTGAKKSEFTIATTSQLFNPVKNGWEHELLDALSLQKSLMQEIVAPGAMIGEVSSDISDETGFSSAPVVAVATHDTGSAVAAVPAEGEDWAYISSGTWSLMGVETKTPIINESACDLNFTNEGGIEGTYRFLKNIAGLWLLSECRRAWSRERAYSYEALTNAAESAKPFVAFVDPDSSRFLNPADMLKAISGFCAETGQKSPETVQEFSRCIFESLALKYRFVLEQLKQAYPHAIKTIHVIGGGSRNPMLCQLTADATGLPVIAGPAEATAVGNIMVQAFSARVVASHAEMRKVIRESFELNHYEPRQTAEWQDAYERFQGILGA